ncbi:hypothetical protein N7463_006543 [Penicillium fimorum]|uniref:Uncharacterized protein n=1 Tax=Penicillium fimorum TaxID=1882269 RepID=A0A9W9XUY0_9EURO|nr:hypothetical protein N7463_006543 [Penicillium fimorum]
MKFTFISSALFLATATLASPGGESIANVMSTSSAAAMSTITDEVAPVSSHGAGMASEAVSKASTSVSGEGNLILTGTVDQVTSTQSISQTSSTSSGSSKTASTTASSTINGAFARPTTIGGAAAGMAGVLGVLVAL